MSHPAHITEAFDHAAIYVEELFGFGRIARQRARGEDAALVRDVQRWRPIGVRFGEEDFALGHDAVHVINRAWNELLE